jgi:hypothetical protein
MNYPESFARGIWQPFRAGSRIHRLIVDAGSTREQFEADNANWLSESGSRYSPETMEQLWLMIGHQKERTQALWLVDQGLARALNPALAMVRQ